MDDEELDAKEMALRVSSFGLIVTVSSLVLMLGAVILVLSVNIPVERDLVNALIATAIMILFMNKFYPRMSKIIEPHFRQMFSSEKLLEEEGYLKSIFITVIIAFMSGGIYILIRSTIVGRPIVEYLNFKALGEGLIVIRLFGEFTAIGSGTIMLSSIWLLLQVVLEHTGWDFLNWQY